MLRCTMNRLCRINTAAVGWRATRSRQEADEAHCRRMCICGYAALLSAVHEVLGSKAAFESSTEKQFKSPLGVPERCQGGFTPGWLPVTPALPYNLRTDQRLLAVRLGFRGKATATPQSFAFFGLKLRSAAATRQQQLGYL